jgi:hypothetical protein
MPFVYEIHLGVPIHDIYFLASILSVLLPRIHLGSIGRQKDNYVQIDD